MRDGEALLGFHVFMLETEKETVNESGMMGIEYWLGITPNTTLFSPSIRAG